MNSHKQGLVVYVNYMTLILDILTWNITYSTKHYYLLAKKLRNWATEINKEWEMF
jgi:hypothetical protein